MHVKEEKTCRNGTYENFLAWKKSDIVLLLMMSLVTGIQEQSKIVKRSLIPSSFQI